MGYKKIIAVLLCLFAAGILVFFLVNHKTLVHESRPYANITDLASAYAADEEIAQAQNSLKSSTDMATIIKGDPKIGHRLAITFDGMAEPATMDRILDLLKKYDVKATFFIEGMNAADNNELINSIEKNGQKIENYTFTGLVHAEKMPQEKLVIDLCRTQKVIKTLTDTAPSLLKGSKMVYTEQLRKTAQACGLKSVVKTDVFLPHNHLHTEAEVAAFVNTLKNGNILSVELGTAVEIKKFEPSKTDDTPAVNKKPGVKALDDSNIESDDVVLELERVLQALKQAKYDTVFVEMLAPIQYSTPVATQISQVENEPMGIPAGTSNLFWDKIKELATSAFSAKTVYAAALTDNQKFMNDLRQKNNGKLAVEQKMLMTTDSSVIYTFGGLTDAVALDNVLSRLKAMNVHGTFFVMEMEMKRYPDAVRKIIANGHEIGIGIRPKAGDGFYNICAEILRDHQILRDQFGIETSLVKQPWGEITDVTKEAISALNFKLIGHTVNVVQSKDKTATSPAEIMPHIFGKSVTALGRGQIVHFRMDYYTNSFLVGQMLNAVKTAKIDNIAYRAYDDDPKENPHNDSVYKIASVGEVLGNKAKLYQYPINENKVPVYLRSEYNSVKISQDSNDFITEAAKRYIGAPLINEDDRMIGFSNKEMRRLDDKGMIHTKDPVIFFTFDDWGLDDSINKLLYVLRKHHVTGTFFILTHNVLNNPNLLRAIGADGNEIGSHSDWHKPMAVRDPKTKRQYGLQTRPEYEEDLSTSYKKLEEIVGDQKVNGRYVLTRFFRPPTLAVSKMGFETLFSYGYTFIVSGAYSTDDYDVKDLNELLQKLQKAIYSPKGINRGTVIVMHMSINAHYTARALDVILTANELRRNDDPLKFQVGRLSDYLTEDYSQADKKTMHNLIYDKVGW